MGYLQYIDYGNSSSPLKVVSLHGFPGVRSKQNREIAQGIADALSCRVRVVLYPGLSTEGKFSFERTIDALLKEFPNIAEHRIDLVGHSFGGFSAILLASRYPQLVHKLVLLSPLLKFASTADQALSFFKNIITSNDGISTESPEDLAMEFEELSKGFNVAQLVAELSPSMPVKFMQARTDTITPTVIAEDLRKYFRGKIDYELVEQDHSFLLDRPTLAKKIAEFLR